MHNINLLPNKGDTLLIQFLNWALTVGRLLIILVETLALGTFLYRFTLDWQIGDLKDSVKQQRAIVSSFKPQEDKFRNLQTRLDLIKKIDTASLASPKILGDIIDMGKGYVTFSNIYVSSTIIRIETKASTVAPLMAFVNSLKQYPPVSVISVDRVENKTSNAEIIVGISLELKQASQSAIVAQEQAQTNGPFNAQK